MNKEVRLQFHYDWSRDIGNKEKEIDSRNELCWFSLTLGYALAKGFSPDDSHDLARWIHYECDNESI